MVDGAPARAIGTRINERFLLQSCDVEVVTPGAPGEHSGPRICVEVIYPSRSFTPLDGPRGMLKVVMRSLVIQTPIPA